jgi:hypothetical protein
MPLPEIAGWGGEESMARETRRNDGERRRMPSPAGMAMGGRQPGLSMMGQGGMAAPPPHPMTAEEDRFEDEDGPFDDGVH